LELKLSVPLAQWAREGFLELSPGEVIDYRDVEARLKWGASMFDVQEICWDPWNSRQISVSMIDQGYQCIEIRQSYKDLNEPTKKVLELVTRGGLHHGDHPVMRWHASCASLSHDNRDNVIFAKPERSKSTARIDGISATTNALARAIMGPGQSVYEERGVITI
jgi:phage terminase large subunit-like protein